VQPEPGGAAIRQTAVCDPAGLWELACRYLLNPVLRLIFAGMVLRIAEMALSDLEDLKDRAEKLP